MDICLGTWQIAPSDGFWQDQDIKRSEEVLTKAVRLGIRHFDSAQSYGKGRSEQTLCKILSRFKDQDFVIDTKIMPSSKNISDILKVSQDRLKGLGIERLYLHWPRTGFDNTALLSAMAELKDNGLVRKIGVCNMGLEELKRILDAGIVIDTFQRPLSLLWTRDWEESLEFCHCHGIEVATYSPLGMGLLSGRYRNSYNLPDARSTLFCFDKRCHNEYLKVLDTLSLVASKNNMTMTDASLCYVASKKPDILLLGARSTSQLESNLEALKKSLDEDSLLALDEVSLELDNASRSVCSNIFSYDY